MSDQRIFSGFKLVSNPNMTETKTVQQRRCWSERLFSWPWRPWQRYKSVVVSEPLGECHILRGHTIIGHPDVIDKIRKKMEESDGE